MMAIIIFFLLVAFVASEELPNQCTEKNKTLDYFSAYYECKDCLEELPEEKFSHMCIVKCAYVKMGVIDTDGFLISSKFIEKEFAPEEDQEKKDFFLLHFEKCSEEYKKKTFDASEEQECEFPFKPVNCAYKTYKNFQHCRRPHNPKARRAFQKAFGDCRNYRGMPYECVEKCAHRKLDIVKSDGSIIIEKYVEFWLPGEKYEENRGFVVNEFKKCDLQEELPTASNNDTYYPRCRINKQPLNCAFEAWEKECGMSAFEHSMK